MKMRVVIRYGLIITGYLPTISEFSLPQCENKFLCESHLQGYFHANQSYFRMRLVLKQWPVAKLVQYTAVSRKVVGKSVHATILKGIVGYFNFTLSKLQHDDVTLHHNQP